MNPFDKIKHNVDKKLHSKIPKKWKKIGDILIADFSLLDKITSKKIAKVYSKILNVKTVIQKEKINGELKKAKRNGDLAIAGKLTHYELPRLKEKILKLEKIDRLFENSCLILVLNKNQIGNERL